MSHGNFSNCLNDMNHSALERGDLGAYFEPYRKIVSGVELTYQCAGYQWSVIFIFFVIYFGANMMTKMNKTLRSIGKHEGAMDGITLGQTVGRSEGGKDGGHGGGTVAGWIGRRTGWIHGGCTRRCNCGVTDGRKNTGCGTGSNGGYETGTPRGGHECCYWTITQQSNKFKFQGKKIATPKQQKKNNLRVL